MKRIGLITFGDIAVANNGYLIRVQNMVCTLEQSSNVDIYQITSKNEVGRYSKSQLFSLDAQKQIKNVPWHEKVLGFNLINIISIQVKSFKKLYRYKNALSQYDEIYLEGCLLIAPYILLKLLRVKNLILDTHCINRMIGSKLKKNNYFKGLLREQSWSIIEHAIFRGSSKLIVVSELEKDYTVKEYKIPSDKIEIIPNQVEGANISKHLGESRRIRESNTEKGNKIVLFVGDLMSVQNRRAAEYIRMYLSDIKGIVLLVVGNNSVNFKDIGCVKFLGYVPSVDPYIVASDICIAPLDVGAGTKTKVLDYMKYNKTIITTESGVEGIDIKDRNDITVTDMKIFKSKLLENVR